MEGDDAVDCMRLQFVCLHVISMQGGRVRVNVNDNGPTVIALHAKHLLYVRAIVCVQMWLCGCGLFPRLLYV